MHLRLSITKPYFIREVSTRNSQSYLGPLEMGVMSLSLLVESRAPRPADGRGARPYTAVAVLDLIVDIFNNPL